MEDIFVNISLITPFKTIFIEVKEENIYIGDTNKDGIPHEKGIGVETEKTINGITRNIIVGEFENGKIKGIVSSLINGEIYRGDSEGVIQKNGKFKIELNGKATIINKKGGHNDLYFENLNLDQAIYKGGLKHSFFNGNGSITYKNKGEQNFIFDMEKGTYQKSPGSEIFHIQKVFNEKEERKRSHKAERLPEKDSECSIF